MLFSRGKTNSCGVAIGYIGNDKVDVLDKTIDKNGRILILDIMIDEINFILVNIYNPNTETEQARNPKSKRYTFRQKHVSGLIQR